MLENQLAFNVKLVRPCIIKLHERVPEDIENHIPRGVFPF
jgi:hypothetical protein